MYKPANPSTTGAVAHWDCIGRTFWRIVSRQRWEENTATLFRSAQFCWMATDSTVQVHAIDCVQASNPDRQASDRICYRMDSDRCASKCLVEPKAVITCISAWSMQDTILTVFHFYSCMQQKLLTADGEDCLVHSTKSH